jgi:hypothetical protein
MQNQKAPTNTAGAIKKGKIFPRKITQMIVENAFRKQTHFRHSSESVFTMTSLKPLSICPLYK